MRNLGDFNEIDFLLYQRIQNPWKTTSQNASLDLSKIFDTVDVLQLILYIMLTTLMTILKPYKSCTKEVSFRFVSLLSVIAKYSESL